MIDRSKLIRRGLTLNYLTIGYNVVEAIVSLLAGLISGSVALLGFGIDSAIEVTSAGAAQVRLRGDYDRERRERLEMQTHRVIGASFLALAVYVSIDAARTLWLREIPDASIPGVVILLLSVVIMPVLASAKRHVAARLESRALKADAKQTSLCAYLSAIALAGVLLNGLLGWWWADPVAALAMVPIIAIEGIEGIRAKACA
jgi:divalent metal cation (Fe/Co/Zn/Cd) transporter